MAILKDCKKRASTKGSTKPRALEITPAGLEELGVSVTPNKIPVLGTVTAGEPILAVEEATDFFPYHQNLSMRTGTCSC